MTDELNIDTSRFRHIPVLKEEIIEFIGQMPEELIKNNSILDLTLGGGGHSSLILEKFPDLKLIGVDQDPEAISFASKRLENFKNRTTFFTSNFADFKPSEKVSIVLADLGISSTQLEKSNRGFSFLIDGPIDMRMNQTKGIKAQELIEQLSENDLANLIYRYGEEKKSRKIARKIKKDLSIKGPYSGTLELAYAIAGCFPPALRHKKIHPATRTFQALRIEINNELTSLETLLKLSPDWLIPEGIISIISFHSLEDRLIKNCFKNDERLEKINRKPITAKENEIESNPRSRSAKLRIAKRKSYKD